MKENGMIMKLAGLIPAFSAIVVLVATPCVWAQGTDFTYQGQLNDAAAPANGYYDFEFGIWDALVGGSQMGSTIVQKDILVEDGLFTVILDFGSGIFTGADRWLQVGVQTNGGGGFTTLAPRTYFTSTPYTIRAISSAQADTATSVPASSIGSAEIVNNSLTSSDLGPNSVGTSEVINNSLLAEDLAPDSVMESEIATGAVGGSEVLDKSLTGADLADSISLGSSGVNGGLFIYSNAGGGSSIHLDGGGTYGGRLWLYNNDGNNGVWMGGGSGNAGVIVLYNTNGSSRVNLDGYGVNGGGSIVIDAVDGSQSVELLGEYGGAGAIEINDSGALTRVRIDGESTGTGGEISVYDDDGTETVEILGAESSTTGSQIALRKADGTTTITLDADYNGDGRITTQELQITGGSDLSEQFDIADPELGIQPGMLVSIDPENPGKLVVSSTAYDRTVAGIVSGAGGVKPGMMMGQDGTIADGRHPVALSGRVYCLVDTTQGMIQPGDLITTSDIPGHGMKVTDHTKAQGAIIGKAMTSLDKGRGLVLVLVSLQ